MIAIDSLKKEESADNKGIKTEDIKGADEETITVVHEIFNLIKNFDDHSDLQERRRDRYRELQVDLCYAVFDLYQCADREDIPEKQSGKQTCGWQQKTSRRHLILYNMKKSAIHLIPEKLYTDQPPY